MINLQAIENQKFTLIEFEIEGGICDPSDLTKINSVRVDASKGVVISGKGPIWLFACLAHLYHATAWIATYDPRLNGGVVVARHAKSAPAIGEIVTVE